MTLSRKLAVAVLCVFVGSAFSAPLPDDVGKRLTNRYIAPAMTAFEASAVHLRDDLTRFCASSVGVSPSQLHESFKRLAGRWARIEFLRFGPLVDANRYERIYFWPDPRANTARQIPAVLADYSSATKPIDLSARSVAVQGLPALEHILYGEGGLLSEARGATFFPACSYATDIAGNVAAVGAELKDAWGGNGSYGKAFSFPSPSSALYRSAQEVGSEAIKALSTGLQFARDVKLLPVLGKDQASAMPRRAPFWRSQLAFFAMAENIDGMLQFHNAGAFDYGEDGWLNDSVKSELSGVRDTLRSLADNTVDTVRSEAGYRRLVLATLMLKNAKALIDEDVAPKFGVRMGFNALDGD